MKDPVVVDCPEQKVNYCKTLHLIDKWNGMELCYVIAKGGRKTHRWTNQAIIQILQYNLQQYLLDLYFFREYHYQQDPNLSC